MSLFLSEVPAGDLFRFLLNTRSLDKFSTELLSESFFTQGQTLSVTLKQVFCLLHYFCKVEENVHSLMVCGSCEGLAQQCYCLLKNF